MALNKVFRGWIGCYRRLKNQEMVPGAGIEPARYFYRGILSPLRLPISPPGPWGLYFSNNSGCYYYFWRISFAFIIMEAEGGIEPPSTALQAAAWPLCHPAIGCGYGTWSCKHNQKTSTLSRLWYWSGKRDSNSRPQPWQGCALPAELFPRRPLFYRFALNCQAKVWLFLD